MSLLTLINRLMGGTMGRCRTQAEIDLELSQQCQWAVAQQQERNRRGLARLRLLDAELQVITRRRDDHSPR